MMAPYLVHVSMWVECAVPGCLGREDLVRNLPVGQGWRLPEPRVPDGWRQVDGMLICPAHTVKIEDGG